MGHTSFGTRFAMAIAAVLLAGNAFAGTFMAEAGISHGSGGDIDATGNGARETLLFDAAFGYRFDNGLGARFLAIADADPYRGLYSTDRSFNDFYGLQAVAYLPVAGKLNLMGGAGVGQTSLNRGDGAGGHEEILDGIVSLGVQFQFVRHFAMELHGDYLTKSGVSGVGLQFQVPF